MMVRCSWFMLFALTRKKSPMSLIKSHYIVTNPRLKRIQRWVWICIYAGLLLLTVSHFLQPLDAALADWAFWLGLPLVVVGCILIYARSRMKE
jgi:hypothetical protein